MSQIVCGRCGHLTASHSTYCPYDRWTLWQDAPQGDPRAAQELAELQLARGVSGFLARRRDEGHRAQLERTIRTSLDTRLTFMEGRIEANPNDWEAQRELGLLSILDQNWARAQAHFERARSLQPDDLQTLVNYGVVLGRRSKWGPAIEVLQEACARAPQNPAALFNLALCGIGARRPEMTLEVVAALENLWQAYPEIAREYHDDGQSARGMALLQLGRPREARGAFEAAARHTSAPDPALVPATPAPPDDPDTPADSDAPFDAEPNGSITTQSLSQQRGDAENAMTEQLLREGGETNADLLINLALVEAQTGEIARATARLSAALRLEPGHPRALNNLGVLSYRQNELRGAVRFLELAKQVEEETGYVEPAILNHLGVALAASGQFAEGLEALAHASGQESAEFEVFYNTGRAFIEHGRPDRGVEYLRQAFAANPNHPDVHAVLGAAYLLRGKPEMLSQAMQHLRRALQLAPAHRTALADVAMAFRDAGQPEHARKAMESGLKTHPRGPELLFLFGLALMDFGDESHWAAAAKAFESARNVAGNFPAAQYNSALSQYLMGLRDSAARLLEQVTAQDPAFSPAYYMIGVGHAAAKRFNEALQAWLTAEKYEPGNPDLQANIGFIYYRRGDYPNAIKHYMAAHRAAPREGMLLTALAMAYARSSVEKALEKAINFFSLSLQIDEFSPVTHMNLGLAYYIHKRPEPALEHWRRVSQLDIDYYKRMEDRMMGDQDAAKGKSSFDDSFMQMRPLNWRARIVGLSPVLPRPHTELLPGENLRRFRPVVPDPELQKLQEMRREMMRLDRVLAWGNVK